MVLRITVQLLAGFDGSDSRHEMPPEWPPAPQRLFGALMAGHASALGEEFDALRWLERQGNPVIHASSQAPAWSASRYVVLPTLVAGKVGSVHLGRHATIQHQAGRSPADPLLRYAWPDAAPPAQVVEALKAAASHIAYFGRATAQALVSVNTDGTDEADAPVGSVWRPCAYTEADTLLRGIYPGLIDDYCAIHAAREQQGVAPSVPGGPPATYTTAPEPSREVEGAATGWRLVGIWSLTRAHNQPAANVIHVAHAVRSAVAAALDGKVGPAVIARQVLGHDPHVQGQAPTREGWGHLAVLPLPRVGHPEAARDLVGVALAVPSEAAFDDTAQRLAALTDETLPLRGWQRPIMLTPGNTEASALLLPGRWTRPASRWVTVYPAVTRFPLEPDRRSPAAVLRRVERLCQQSGIPSPAEARVHRAPHPAYGVWLRAADTARPKDSHLPSVHLTLTFDRPVRGPVLLGHRRHFGLGLCHPLDSGAPDG